MPEGPAIWEEMQQVRQGRIVKSNIEILLGEWGAWRRRENKNPLGYPDQSAFVRMRVDGQRQSDPYALLVDDDLRTADDLIKAMHPDYTLILATHYIKSGPVKTKAHGLRISVRAYYVNLEHAHRTLAHQMGGKYESGFEPKLCTHVDLVCAQM